MNYWNLDEAVDLIRALQPVAHKHFFALALGGSVLNKGSSSHDLDIIIHEFTGKRDADVRLFVMDCLECLPGLRYLGGEGCERQAMFPHTLMRFSYKHPENGYYPTVEFWFIRFAE